MLFVSVPRALRAQVVPQMAANSEQLVTHFDVHATLMDVWDVSI